MGKGQRNIKIPTLAGKSDGGKARPKKRGTRGTSILYASYRAYQMAGSDVTLANSMPLPSLSLSLFLCHSVLPGIFPFRPVGARSVDRVIYEHHRCEGHGGSRRAREPAFSFLSFAPAEYVEAGHPGAL